MRNALGRGETEPREISISISEAIAEIDRRVHAQVNEILHAAKFRALEASWSSLEYLVAQMPVDPGIQLRVLNVKRDELLGDFEDSIEFDRTAMFQLVYEQEFGKFGGDPYTVLVADYHFSQSGEDVELLQGLAEVGAAAHCVVAAGASPELLGYDHWGEFSLRGVPEEVYGGPATIPWMSFRRRDDARYVALCMPRFLLRRPYRPDDPDRQLRLREGVPASGDARLWGNSAYLLAERAMQAFHRYGWCTALRGLYDEQGVPGGLVRESASTDAEGLVPLAPVEVRVTESQEKGLLELGLVPLCAVSGTATVSFFGVPSVHLPRNTDDEAVNSNLKLSAQIPYMFAASRFAHYMKVMLRDKVGAYTDADGVQRELSQWLAKYTLDDDDAPDERKAQYPLREYNVMVREKAGRPGELECIAQLKPHYQIEDPGVALRLAVDLPNPEDTKR
ncbi:MAG: type VI secretion system contractile sheath large subunit [Planctomycetota bacterium]